MGSAGSANLRLLVAGGIVLAAAASAAVAAPAARLNAVEPSAIVLVGDDAAYEDRHGDREVPRRGAVVDAPLAHVESGDPVIVDAPGTHVGIHRGHVHVVAPFVNLWIPR